MNIDCYPYPLPDDRAPQTILAHAARVADAAGKYRDAMDARRPYTECIRLASTLARACDGLTSAIADAVACGDNRLS